MGSNKITITASNGKVFTGTLDNYAALVNELNVYEADLKLKKQKEQEERAKAVAEQKAKEEKKTALVNQIKKASNELYSLLKKYEEQEGHSFTYYSDDFKDINLTRLINGLVNGWWSF